MDNLRPLVDFMGMNEYMCNGKLSVVDFVVFEHIEMALKLTDNGVFRRYPELEAYHARIKNLPGLKEFYESDRMIKEPFIVPMAKYFF